MVGNGGEGESKGAMVANLEEKVGKLKVNGWENERN